MRVRLDSTYREIKTDLLSQLYLQLGAEPKIANITDKILKNRKNNWKKCNKCQNFNKVQLFRRKSLKLYAVLYMQDIVVKDASCMQEYLHI